MSAVTRPALRYHGGKWMLAPWIIQHFPEHRVYTEPYGGAGSVLMRKPRAKLVEIYNELGRRFPACSRYCATQSSPPNCSTSSSSPHTPAPSLSFHTSRQQIR